MQTRVRLPADLLRCIINCIEIALLVGLGLLAGATTRGLETDVSLVGERIARGLVAPLHFLALLTLLILPVALAARQIYVRQLRLLAEAVAIGLIATGVTIGCDALIRLHGLSQLYHALARFTEPLGWITLDPYLAGLVAYLTVIGLSGRPRWRAWFYVAIGFYCLTSLALVHETTTVLSLLITLLIGTAIATGLRYVIGTSSQRPTAVEIAGALSAVASPVTEIRRVTDNRTENRRYKAVSVDGPLDVVVFDRDQQAADALYRIYRRVRVTSQVSRSAPLTVVRAVERRALLIYAAEDAGVATPKLEALLRVGPEAALLATRHHHGTTLAEYPGGPSDEQLSRVWDTVLQLHGHRVTHRALTPDHILLTGRNASEVMLLDPGDGDVAASELQLRLDLAQLTAALALLVGPQRSADLARRKLGPDEAGRLVPLLQPVALHRSTRAALSRRKEVLPALRRGLIGGGQEEQPPSAQLERIRPRSIVTLVAGIFAAYIVIGQLGRVSFANVLRHSDWRWALVALALSAGTYVGAAWSLSGFVLEKLRLSRTILAQLAASFVTLVTPAAVGGVALNLRYLTKAKVAPADAGSSVGVSQVFAFTLHLMMLVIFAALAGVSTRTTLRPPGWSYIALAVLAAAIAVVFALPAGRRLVRSRVAPALGQVIPRLLDIAQRPGKLAEGIGGALVITGCYILCLAVSVLAVGGHAPFFAIAVVYLTGSAIGSLVPTPGGVGAVEAAMSAGLSAIAHMPGATAVSAVLLYRLATFWLPIPVGWVAMSYLQRHDAL